MRGSIALTARAVEAPAKPPPTTTTRPAAGCATAGNGKSAVDAVAAADLMKSRRLFLVMISILLCGIPGRYGSYFVFGKAFGDAIHDGRWTLAGTKRLHGSDDLGGVASDKP